MNQDFDIYLTIKASDWDVAKKAVPYIRKNIAPKRIVVVSSKELKSKTICDEEFKACVFMDEDSVFEGMSYGAVKAYLKSMNCIESNAGWYLQQFIKLALCYTCKDDYYLVWDADTIPLNPISFFDENGKPFFNLKREYFKVYFTAIKNLLGYAKKTKESFISEHMLFNVKIVKAMLEKIMTSQKYGGENFWQKILEGSDLHSKDLIKDDERYFSEFETYGTFCDYEFPDFYVKRKLRTLRPAADYLGFSPSEEILSWIAKDFDTASFEVWAETIEECKQKVEDKSFRDTNSFADYLLTLKRQMDKDFYKAILKRDMTFIRKYRFFAGHTKFDFFFGNQLACEHKDNIFYRIFRKILLTILRIESY